MGYVSVRGLCFSPPENKEATLRDTITFFSY